MGTVSSQAMERDGALNPLLKDGSVSLEPFGEVPTNLSLQSKYESDIAVQLWSYGLEIPEIVFFPTSLHKGQLGVCKPPQTADGKWRVVGVTYEACLDRFPRDRTDLIAPPHPALATNIIPGSLRRRPRSNDNFELNPDVLGLQLFCGLHEAAHYVALAYGLIKPISHAHLNLLKSSEFGQYRFLEEDRFADNIGERIADGAAACYMLSNYQGRVSPILSACKDFRLDWGWSRSSGRLMKPGAAISHNTHSTIELVEASCATIKPGMDIVQCVKFVVDIIAAQKQLGWEQAKLEMLRELDRNPGRRCPPAVKPEIDRMRADRDEAHERLAHLAAVDTPSFGGWRKLMFGRPAMR